jgi:hypothetical protein
MGLAVLQRAQANQKGRRRMETLTQSITYKLLILPYISYNTPKLLINILIMEELAGCFIKTSKASKVPVTRYFLLDQEHECVRYFENSIQLRKALSKNLS